jgi:hypothetical protein
VGGVPGYLVETYAASSSVRKLIAEARAAAESLAREGVPVSYVRSTFVPGDEICLHMFEAPSADAIAELTRRAALDHARTVEALEPGPFDLRGDP